MSPSPQLSGRGLERRLKRHVLKKSHTFFAPCAPGFEDVLAAEIAALPELGSVGPSSVSAERGGVTFSGPLDTLYHANLQLRTAHRVLLRVETFLAQSYPALFDRAGRVPWEHYLGFQPSYRLRVSAKASRLRHHKKIADTVESAVLKRLKPLGLAPRHSDEAPLAFQLRFFEDRCTLSLDTSGEHLHRRGYRRHVSDAPLRETLASAALLRAQWQNYPVILDPLCGAGTLLTEAALLASHRAPGIEREFAFEHMPSFQPSKWERFKREAEARQTVPTVRLIGSDVQPSAVAAARANAARAGLSERIQLEVESVLELSPPAEQGLLISNLPYGKRIEGSQTALLSNLARHLSATFSGWDFAFISHSSAWAEPLAQELSVQRFQNGGLDVVLLQGRIA